MFRPLFFTLALIASGTVMAQTTSKPSSVPRAQVVANAEVEFTKVDTNKDGHMSRAEIETFQSATSLRRITASNNAAFAQLDSDKNGQLSPTEFAKLNPVPKADATAVLRIDTNKDDKISLAEHRAATIDTFNRLDGNKDGILTAEEVKMATEAPKK